MGLFSKNNLVKYKDQDYNSLRKKLIGTKELFEDPLFAANDHILSLTKPLPGKVIWKRPPELCESPKLFVEKASSKDVTQGVLGNCWVVAACGALATCKPLWSQVIPDYKLQEWDPVYPERYAGIFHFRFWRFGKWIDIVVDDRLPTINGQLIFCHSSTENEYWSALLEKAYAKLCGSYGAMDGGNLADALIDFTSGLSEIIELKNNGYDNEEKRDKLRKQIIKEHEEHSLMCCAISTSDSALLESRTKNGLVLGHAYGITEIKKINIGSTSLLTLFSQREKLTLIRLRNPWGAKEWNGPFSDSKTFHGGGNDGVCNINGHGSKKAQIFPVSATSQASSPPYTYAYTSQHLIQLNSRSPEWNKISKSEKEKLGLTFEDDGEFWMPFDDFVTEFTDLCICNLINTSFFTFKKAWYENAFEGQWTIPNNAGGCINHDTFLKNPQYLFDVPKDNMEIIVLLLQTDMRGQWVKTEYGTRYKSIGFHIMKMEDNRKYRAHQKGTNAVTSDYVLGRSVFFQGTLDKGRYILLPTTFEPKVETEYYLRIYTEDQIKVKQLIQDHPQPSPLCGLCCSPPMCVTVITVEGARGLAQADNTYCIIKVEGQKLRSPVVPLSQNPDWKLKGVFFRKDVCKPMFVELWGQRFLKDKFLGCAVIVESTSNVVKSISSPLVGRGRKQSERHPGELTCSLITYDDLSVT